MILQLILLGLGELLLACTISLPDQHFILAGLPSVEPFPNPPLDHVEGGNVGGAFQDHHIEDDEPLHVTPALPHTPNLIA